MRTDISGTTGHQNLLFHILHNIYKVLDDTRESHKRHSQQAGRNQGNGCPLHTIRHMCHGQLLADAGENDQRQGEADTDGNRVDDSLQQVIVLLDNLDRDTQHAAVRRNQRQEDPQRGKKTPNAW